MIKDMFPELKWKYTQDKQIEQILDEVDELKVEVKNKDRERTLYEAIDVMYSTATFLYISNFSEEEIDKGLEYVRQKNKDRGYLHKADGEDVTYRKR